MTASSFDRLLHWSSWPLSVLTVLSLLNTSCHGLVIHHHFDAGMAPFSYQTFSGVAMYSAKDAPSRSGPGNGKSYIDFDLYFERDTTERDAFVELIVIPDVNIDDIGFKEGGELHLCCNAELIGQYDCDEGKVGQLMIPKDIKGLHREKVPLEGASEYHLETRVPVQVTAIHVFALSSCDSNLAGTGGAASVSVTFWGRSLWMNPYGQLPGDVYGYLPFYGWMSMVYLGMALIWLGVVAVYWNELLHVQQCITGVLALCLLEMATWYLHYVHLNAVGTVHHGPFILGLVATCCRRTVSRMLVVAVSTGYGVVKPNLAPSVRNKLIVLGVTYLVFAFMFEALIHYNQTEKVSSWLRVLLIPPVAICNGLFWWWTFVALNRTIEELKVRRQTAKLSLYKALTVSLVATLMAAITFAVYEMYYVLKELYFAQWQQLWFMEVGFWQILFSAIFATIMVLWRPSPHFKKYAFYNQGPSGDHADEYGDADDQEAADMNAPETFADNIKRRKRDHDDTMGDEEETAPKFAIHDDDAEEAEDDRGDDQFDYDRKPNTTLTDTINIEMTESINAKVD